MIITALSDWHGKFDLHVVPESDVICIAGDMLGEKNDVERLEDWLIDLPAKYVFYVPGNHDGLLGVDWKPIGYPKVKNLARKPVSCLGSKFAGFSWSYTEHSPGFADAFEYCTEDANKIFDLVQEIPKCDVLVTHSPPYRCLDYVNGRHLGLPWLPGLLSRHGTYLVFCGHVHEYGGKSEFIVCPRAVTPSALAEG